ncbi:hypothetical protein JXA27_01335 [Aerococcaceae bacterium zg-B36]|uniref:hypothetical protein n=1 Tax=Aerococcaceae bacterium zg-252 TaxID=2796928 RepID=UPI001BD8CC65|nr:hypothetical protein [Aerococcaceae bacterium zg-B36]
MHEKRHGLKGYSTSCYQYQHYRHIEPVKKPITQPTHQLPLNEWLGKRVRIRSQYYVNERMYLKKNVGYVAIELPCSVVRFVSHHQGECNRYVHEQGKGKTFLIKRVIVSDGETRG